MEKAHASSMGCSLYGSAETIKGKLDTLIEETNADELMVAATVWDVKRAFDHSSCWRER